MNAKGSTTKERPVRACCKAIGKASGLDTLRQVNRLRGLLAILEEVGPPATPPNGFAALPRSDAGPPTFANVMQVIERRSR